MIKHVNENIHNRDGLVDKNLNQLDLANVKSKLMLAEPEGKGWTQGQVDKVEMWYKRFLYMISKYPDASIVPNGAIDIFWHQHILFTELYARDCKKVFGYFLHHKPDSDLKNDPIRFTLANKITKQLYKKEFGEDDTVIFSDHPDESLHGVSASWACAPEPACSYVKGSMQTA